MKTARTLTAVPLVLAMALSGCGGESDSSTPSTPASAPTSKATEEETTEEETTEEETTEEETTEEEAAEGEAAFGSPVKVSDNLTVTVTEPKDFEPSEYAFVEGDWDKFIKMNITAENTGDEPLEAFGMSFRATSGSKESEQIFDSEAGLDAPTAVIQPGRSLEFSVGFGVLSGEPFDLTIEDMMDFMGDGATLSIDIE